MATQANFKPSGRVYIISCFFKGLIVDKRLSSEFDNQNPERVRSG